MIQRKEDPNATAVRVGDNDNTGPVDELETLAAGVEQTASADAAQQGGAGQGQGEEAAAPAFPPAIVAGVALLPVWGLRLLRERIARTLPEIRNHWTDEAIQGPGEAAAPLLLRYMDRLAPFAQAYPEATLLVVACLPLGLGYVAALEEHDAKQAKEVPTQSIAQVVNSGGVTQEAGHVSASGALSHASA